MATQLAIRAGLVIAPVSLSCGTLKSTRMITRRPFNGTSVIDFFIRNSRCEFLGGNLLEQVHAAVAIAPLVVVPGSPLKEPLVELDAGSFVEESSGGVNEIAANDFVLGIDKDVLEVGFAGPLNRRRNIGVAVSFTVFTVGSTTETVGTGTRKDMPVSLPFTSGQTRARLSPLAVVLGMMFWPRPGRPSNPFCSGPSTVFCVAV